MNEGFDASELMRTGMRLMIEQALETEVDEALGRGRYERTDLPTRGCPSTFMRRTVYAAILPPGRSNIDRLSEMVE